MTSASVGSAMTVRLPLVRIALRNVVRNRRRSMLALFAVGLSVWVVIGVRGLLNGLQGTLKEKVVLGQLGAVQIHKQGFSKNVRKSPLTFALASDDALLAKVRAVPGVVAATPRINFATMVNANDTTVFSLASAVDPKAEYEVCPRRRDDVGPGSVVTNEGGVLSLEVKKPLAVEPGAELVLMAPDKEGILNAALMKVGGVLAGNVALSGDQKLVFVPIGIAQELLRMPGEVTEIAVRVTDYERPEAVAAAIGAALGPDYEVQTWRELAAFLVEILRNQDFILSFIVTIFTVVALLGIVNTMLMSVLERTREIGTMLALGVRRKQIVRLFILESAFLGGLGALIGGALGVGLVVTLNLVGLPIQVPAATVPDLIHPVVSPAFVLSTLAAAMLGGAVAAVYPARRAAKLKPVEAMAAV